MDKVIFIAFASFIQYCKALLPGKLKDLGFVAGKDVLAITVGFMKHTLYES